MSGFDERDLSRALHERSGQVGGHPVGLDAVKADARRIQRRRRAVAGAVAAVVVAIAVPVGLTIGGTAPSGVGPVGQPTPTAASVSPTSRPSPTPTSSDEPSQAPSATPAPGTVPLTLAGAPAGQAPAISWIDGRTLHQDGVTDQLPGDYTDVASYRGGWLAVGSGNAGSTITRIDGSGQVTGTAPGGSRIVASGDGTQIAWVEDGAVHSALASGMSDAEGSQPVTQGMSAEVVGWASGQVVYTLSGGDGASVHVTDMAGKSREVPGLINAWGSHDETGLIAGETRYNSDGTSCWGVFHTSGAKVWEGCDWALHAFSPSGRYVVGTPSGCDGIGCSTVVLLDARDGSVVTRFESPRTPVTESATWAWEDDTHLLTTVWDGTSWAILRLGVDGSVERAAGPAKAPDFNAPYHLVGH